MSNDYFESALNSLASPKNHDRDRLLKILVTIRKEIDWPKKRDNINKLREKGCLKQLVTCLQQHHLGILNTALSILGNCCMDRMCAKDAVKQYNLLPHLNHVLKRNKQDSIRGRIFRIIGNMCQHWDRLANTMLEREPQLQLVTKIVSFLKSVVKCDSEASQSSTTSPDTVEGGKPSEATIIMAIRTLRLLANIDTVTLLIRDYGVIKAIGMILIKYVPMWENTKEHEGVLNVVLKLLHVYSKYKSYNSIPELQNTEIGNAMTHLSKLVCLSPYIVVKIIMNLIKLSNLRSDLPIVDISQNLIDKLKSSTNFSSGREDLLHREYLKCLCFLIQHPANKEEMRNVGLIPVLLVIMNDLKQPTDVALKNCILIISTLRMCMYDETSLLAMLKCGIINALIDKLEWVLGSGTAVDTTHECKFRKYGTHESRKRRRFMSSKCFMHQITSEGIGIPYCNSFCSDISTDFYKFKERSISPSSDISLSSGPSFSPPSSPAVSDGDFYTDGDESDSDNYSPVCSDAEGEQSTNVADDAEDDFVNGESPYYNDETEDRASFSESTTDKGTMMWKRDLSNEIMKLVKLFTQIRPVVMELCCSSLLIKLLIFLLPRNRYICPPDTLAVVLLVVETPEYLLGLMQTDFITAAHKFSALQHGISCVTCTNLYTIGRDILLKFTVVVEFGRGKGDIAHQLYRANLPIKQKLVSVIPLLIDNKFTLNKLMITCGGLNILIKLFQESMQDQHKCVTSLCVMAKKLGIKNPAAFSEDQSDKFVLLPIDVKHYELSQECTTVVRFMLDDGTCLQADRDFLSQKSEYFNRLLCGEFKESLEQEVQLCNVPNKSLRLLLMLLQYDVNNTEVHKVDAELDVILDVIALTDRYLMEDLCNTLTVSVQYFKFLPATIPTIYQWSLESGTNILRIESVAYALVATMDECERKEMFQNLFRLGYTEHLADDIQKLLTRFLSLLRNE